MPGERKRPDRCGESQAERREPVSNPAPPAQKENEAMTQAMRNPADSLVIDPLGMYALIERMEKSRPEAVEEWLNKPPGPEKAQGDALPS